MLYRAIITVANRARQQTTVETPPFMHDPTPPTVDSVQICDHGGKRAALQLQTTGRNHNLRLCISMGLFLPSSGISGFHVQLERHTHGGRRTVVLEQGEITLEDMWPPFGSKLVQYYATGELPCGEISASLVALNGGGHASDPVLTTFSVVCQTPQVRRAIPCRHCPPFVPLTQPPL